MGRKWKSIKKVVEEEKKWLRRRGKWLRREKSCKGCKKVAWCESEYGKRRAGRYFGRIYGKCTGRWLGKQKRFSG